jgi:large subunit ribosomal protein L9
MRVLLLKDVYKLGHAGDVKKVADGFGRNYLIPQGLAVLATPAAMKRAENLRQNAAIIRSKLNEELAGVAERLAALKLTFPAKAGETGKLYGSITTMQIAAKIKEATGLEIDRRHVGHQPLRELGEFKVPVQLTADLVPNVTVIIHREGEAPKTAAEAAAAESAVAEPAAPETEEAAAAETAEAPAAEG